MRIRSLVHGVMGALVPLCAVLVCAPLQRAGATPLTEEQAKNETERKAALSTLGHVRPLQAGRLVGSRTSSEICPAVSDEARIALRAIREGGVNVSKEIAELKKALQSYRKTPTDPPVVLGTNEPLPLLLPVSPTLLKKLSAHNPTRPTVGDLDVVAKEQEQQEAVIKREAKQLSERLRLREAWVEKYLRSCSFNETGPGGGAVYGISWQSAVVTGLANFVADRAQQELILWLQDQLLNKLCEGQEKDVFSNTCEAVGSSKQAPAALGRFFAGMVRKDLEQVPTKLLYMALSKAAEGNPAAQQDLKLMLPVLKNLSAMVLAMKSGDSPTELLARFAEETRSLGTSCQREEGNLPCAVALIGTWVKYIGSLNMVDRSRFENPALLKAHLVGMLASQDFVAALTLTLNQARAPQWLSPFMQKLVLELKNHESDTTVQALEAVAEAVLATEGSREALQELFKAISTLEKRLDRLNELQNRSVAFRIEWAADVSRLTLAVIEQGAELVSNPNAEVMTQLQSLQHVFAALAAFSRGEHPEGLRETIAALSLYKKALPEELGQFLPLLTDLAATNTVDEVQSALSAAAAPIGSWRAKRRKPWSVTISALAGLSAGGEFPLSSRLSFVNNAGLAGGPLAAVGLDVAFRISRKGNPTDWTIGPFFSVLDLGQLAYARVLSGDGTAAGSPATANTASEVSFLNVLSPGAYLRVGAGNSPLTLGVGAAFAPQMRQYLFTTATGAQDKELFSMLRLMAFLAVDVSLFRIH